jgi:integrase/recombinase XerD
MILLSTKAGMRAKEIALLTWEMVTDAQGQIALIIALPNRASKGKRGGRTIPMHPMLHEALQALYIAREGFILPESCVVYSERGGHLSSATVRLWFHRIYANLHMIGCSSNSGRRTFITRAARAVAQVGGSLRDVQHIAGHAELSTTQMYIETDTETRHKLVALL